MCNRLETTTGSNATATFFISDQTVTARWEKTSGVVIEYSIVKGLTNGVKKT